MIKPLKIELLEYVIVLISTRGPLCLIQKFVILLWRFTLESMTPPNSRDKLVKTKINEIINEKDYVYNTNSEGQVSRFGNTAFSCISHNYSMLRQYDSLYSCQIMAASRRRGSMR